LTLHPPLIYNMNPSSFSCESRERWRLPYFCLFGGGGGTPFRSTGQSAPVPKPHFSSSEGLAFHTSPFPRSAGNLFPYFSFPPCDEDMFSPLASTRDIEEASPSSPFPFPLLRKIRESPSFSPLHQKRQGPPPLLFISFFCLYRRWPPPLPDAGTFGLKRWPLICLFFPATPL